MNICIQVFLSGYFKRSEFSALLGAVEERSKSYTKYDVEHRKLQRSRVQILDVVIIVQSGRRLGWLQPFVVRLLSS